MPDAAKRGPVGPKGERGETGSQGRPGRDGPTSVRMVGVKKIVGDQNDPYVRRSIYSNGEHGPRDDHRPMLERFLAEADLPSRAEVRAIVIEELRRGQW